MPGEEPVSKQSLKSLTPLLRRSFVLCLNCVLQSGEMIYLIVNLEYFRTKLGSSKSRFENLVTVYLRTSVLVI